MPEHASHDQFDSRRQEYLRRRTSHKLREWVASPEDFGLDPAIVLNAFDAQQSPQKSQDDVHADVEPGPLQRASPRSFRLELDGDEFTRRGKKSSAARSAATPSSMESTQLPRASSRSTEPGRGGQGEDLQSRIDSLKKETLLMKSKLQSRRRRRDFSRDPSKEGAIAACGTSSVGGPGRSKASTPREPGTADTAPAARKLPGSKLVQPLRYGGGARSTSASSRSASKESGSRRKVLELEVEKDTEVLDLEEKENNNKSSTAAPGPSTSGRPVVDEELLGRLLRIALGRELLQGDGDPMEAASALLSKHAGDSLEAAGGRSSKTGASKASSSREDIAQAEQAQENAGEPDLVLVDVGVRLADAPTSPTELRQSKEGEPRITEKTETRQKVAETLRKKGSSVVAHPAEWVDVGMESEKPPECTTSSETATVDKAGSSSSSTQQDETKGSPAKKSRNWSPPKPKFPVRSTKKTEGIKTHNKDFPSSASQGIKPLPPAPPRPKSVSRQRSGVADAASAGRASTPASFAMKTASGTGSSTQSEGFSSSSSAALCGRDESETKEEKFAKAMAHDKKMFSQVRPEGLDASSSREQSRKTTKETNPVDTQSGAESRSSSSAFSSRNGSKVGVGAKPRTPSAAGGRHGSLRLEVPTASVGSRNSSKSSVATRYDTETLRDRKLLLQELTADVGSGTAATRKSVVPTGTDQEEHDLDVVEKVTWLLEQFTGGTSTSAARGSTSASASSSCSSRDFEGSGGAPPRPTGIDKFVPDHNTRPDEGVTTAAQPNKIESATRRYFKQHDDNFAVRGNKIYTSDGRAVAGGGHVQLKMMPCHQQPRSASSSPEKGAKKMKKSASTTSLAHINKSSSSSKLMVNNNVETPSSSSAGPGPGSRTTRRGGPPTRPTCTRSRSAAPRVNPLHVRKAAALLRKIGTSTSPVLEATRAELSSKAGSTSSAAENQNQKLDHHHDYAEDQQTQLPKEAELPSQSKACYASKWDRLSTHKSSKKTVKVEEETFPFKPELRAKGTKLPSRLRNVKPRFLQAADAYVEKRHEQILLEEAQARREREEYAAEASREPGFALPAPGGRAGSGQQQQEITSEDELELQYKFKATPAPKFRPCTIPGKRNYLRLQEAARLDRERKQKIEAKMTLRPTTLAASPNLGATGAGGLAGPSGFFSTRS